jgi:hypothetical protein
VGSPLGDGYRGLLWVFFQKSGTVVDFVGGGSNGPSSLPDRDHQGTSGERADELAPRIPTPPPARPLPALTIESTSAAIDDRLDGNDIPLIYEFIALMLGVRRGGVTETLHLLEGVKAIKNARGLISFLERQSRSTACLKASTSGSSGRLGRLICAPKPDRRGARGGERSRTADLLTERRRPSTRRRPHTLCLD